MSACKFCGKKHYNKKFNIDYYTIFQFFEVKNEMKLLNLTISALNLDVQDVGNAFLDPQLTKNVTFAYVGHTVKASVNLELKVMDRRKYEIILTKYNI